MPPPGGGGAQGAAAAVRRAHGSAASGAATACGAVCTPSFFTAPSVKAGADGQDHQPGDGEEGGGQRSR